MQVFTLDIVKKNYNTISYFKVYAQWTKLNYLKIFVPIMLLTMLKGLMQGINYIKLIS